MRVTQSELAKAIGVSRASVANFEAGRQRVSLEKLYAIAEALQCEPAELLPSLDELGMETSLPLSGHDAGAASMSFERTHYSTEYFDKLLEERDAPEADHREES